MHVVQNFAWEHAFKYIIAPPYPMVGSTPITTMATLPNLLTPTAVHGKLAFFFTHVADYQIDSMNLQLSV